MSNNNPVSQSVADIYTYAELRVVVYHPDDAHEKLVVSKINSWTPYFIFANEQNDHKILLYILKRKPYLSVKLMQEAKCYPLHRLVAGKSVNISELMFTLLDSPYFHLSDLRSP